MHFEILTLFPDVVETVLSASIIGRARAAGLISVNCRQIRDYSADRHRKTEDTLYGGGTGLLMTPQPIADCVEAARADCPPERRCRVVYLSPKGRLFSQRVAEEYKRECDHLILLCGHYEGVDQRAIDACVDEELSVGDFVLTGGEIPACIVVDAVSRLLDGVLACEESYTDESVASGLLECPHYTHPAEWRGMEVPPVLLTGHHANIAQWRLAESLRLTRERRPDLYEKWLAEHPAPPEKKKRGKPAAAPRGDACPPAPSASEDETRGAARDDG